MSRRFVILGIVALVILALVGAGVVVFRPRGVLTNGAFRGLDTGELPAEIADPTQTMVPPTPTTAAEDLILAKFQETTPDYYLDLRNGEEFRAVDLKILEEWALIEATVVDAETGEPTVGEGTIILFRKVNGAWTPAYRGTDRYKAWLDEIPETLVPADLKMLLR